MSQITLIPLSKVVTKTIEIPGSKSYTNRSLILASLTKGSVRIINPLFSDDTKALIHCLKTLGIKIEILEKEIRVIGDISEIRDREYNLNVNLSGTTIRFLLALCCIVSGIKILRGEGRLNERPIAELVGSLKDLGAKIEYLEKDGYPPLKITSSKLNPGTTRLHGDISSQFFSSLFMIAPIIGGMEIEVIGNHISTPYIDMTIDLMEYFGVKMRNLGYKKYLIKNGKYQTQEYSVEGDFSSAGYFLAVAALTYSTITLKNLNPNSKQADIRFLEILESMGNEIIKADNEITITGKRVKAMNVNMESFPDQVQTLAVLAAFANGKTIISGVRSLRVKETERVLALQTELAKMEIKTESTTDSLTIYGGDPKPAEIDTYNDHRMAMSFAIAGSKISGMKINNPEVVSKTFPEFWEKLESIGIGVEKDG